MFSLFKSKEQKGNLRDEAVAALRQVRGAAQRTAEHVSAVGALLSEEIKEYAAHQAQRLVMVIVACVLLLGAYLLLCSLLVAVLSIWLGLVGALGIIFLLNLVVALWLLVRAKKMAGKQLAPATVEEIKNDWQCLKLLCKENSKP